MKITRLSSQARLPRRASDGAAGYDLFAAVRTVVPAACMLEGRVNIGRALVPTGVALSIPEGHVGRIGSRSGLSVKHNIEVGAGWIDSDYRGELKVELKNFSGLEFIVEEGDRIAQLIIFPIVTPALEEVDSLSPTTRGTRGFGSTGAQ